MIAFHLTPASNLPSIKEVGLIPACGSRSSSLGEPRPGVFLFPSPDDLCEATSWFVDAIADETEGAVALLAVDLEGIDVIASGHPSGHAAPFEVIARAAIPADRIAILHEDALSLTMAETDALARRASGGDPPSP